VIFLRIVLIAYLELRNCLEIDLLVEVRIMETLLIVVLLVCGIIAGWIIRHRVEVERLKTLDNLGMIDQALYKKPEVKEDENDKGTK
jgi:hypothetical protein